ncbi:hypothetical protein [Haloarchaeobius sp. TZWSO28]|uniref:hypothetical protein n=1 Tax=Haloarchaeobius sp. TZWSO28 TaxID=3446119 RepID=UPI003EBFFE68
MPLGDTVRINPFKTSGDSDSQVSFVRFSEERGDMRIFANFSSDCGKFGHGILEIGPRVFGFKGVYAPQIWPFTPKDERLYFSQPELLLKDGVVSADTGRLCWDVFVPRRPKYKLELRLTQEVFVSGESRASSFKNIKIFDIHGRRKSEDITVDPRSDEPRVFEFPPVQFNLHPDEQSSVRINVFVEFAQSDEGDSRGRIGTLLPPGFLEGGLPADAFEPAIFSIPGWFVLTNDEHITGWEFDEWFRTL